MSLNTVQDLQGTIHKWRCSLWERSRKCRGAGLICGLPFMTWAKFWGFWAAPPLHPSVCIFRSVFPQNGPIFGHLLSANVKNESLLSCLKCGVVKECKNFWVVIYALSPSWPDRDHRMGWIWWRFHFRLRLLLSLHPLDGGVPRAVHANAAGMPVRGPGMQFNEKKISLMKGHLNLLHCSTNANNHIDDIDSDIFRAELN